MFTWGSLWARQGVGKGPGNEEFVLFFFQGMFTVHACVHIYAHAGREKHIHVYLWRWIQGVFLNGFRADFLRQGSLL